MGVKHSKQSVDISSTPVKAGVSVEVNGKIGEEKTEKIESITKLNGEVEKSNGVNGDAHATNGDIKAEDKETPSGDAPVVDEKKDLDETKENEETEAQETAETSKDEGKKESTKDKIKKKLSMRSLNFLRRKPKSKDDAENSKNEEDADKTVEEENTEENKQTEDKKVGEEAIEETKAEDTVKPDEESKKAVPVMEENVEEKVEEKVVEAPSTTEDKENKTTIEEINQEE